MISINIERNGAFKGWLTAYRENRRKHTSVMVVRIPMPLLTPEQVLTVVLRSEAAPTNDTQALEMSLMPVLREKGLKVALQELLSPEFDWERCR